MLKVAALFVQYDGCYFGLDDVDPWGKARDARLYSGPYPVVAHPPCQRWGKMWYGSPTVVARKKKRFELGDDDGCFQAALNAVRRWGGILEHPEHSYAWDYFGLKRPSKYGGWSIADNEGGRTCLVEQRAYGHTVRKPTWLYAVDCDLPNLNWGKTEAKLDDLIDKIGAKKAKRRGEVGALSKLADREATPIPFRDLLLRIARSSYYRIPND